MRNDHFIRNARPDIVQEMPPRRFRLNLPALVALVFCLGFWVGVVALFGRVL